MREASPVVVRPVPRPAAEHTLVCFSYCGGGTAPFRSWGKVLPANVELALICYPGREGRFTEPFARNWTELRDDAVTALRPVINRPYTLFGHSMGGWMAFEVAAHLEQTRSPAPSALVVSACDAPTNWARHRLVPPTVHDTDEFLVSWMSEVGQLSDELLAEPELRQMAIDLLRADMRVSDSYRYYPGVTVRAPIRVCYGVEDADVRAAGAQGWQEVAAGPIRVDQLPGGHFYTDEVWATLPTRLSVLAGQQPVI